LSDNGEKQPRWRFLLSLAIALALVYAGFEIGRMSAGYSIASAMIERIDLHGQNHALEKENRSLRHRAATAEVAQRVDRQAQTDAQRMMSELQAETARQQQELQFYRGLAVRQFGSGTLRVQELRIRAGEEQRRYRVLITLVQAASRDSLANGTVTFTVQGLARGEPKELTLAEIEPAKRRELPFSLRFFQQIEVPVELPPDFVPASLHVAYRLGRNAEPTRQAFNWRVEGETETPVL
jgi:uncharacterized protein DUF6776